MYTFSCDCESVRISCEGMTKLDMLFLSEKCKTNSIISKHAVPNATVFSEKTNTCYIWTGRMISVYTVTD